MEFLILPLDEDLILESPLPHRSLDSPIGFVVGAINERLAAFSKVDGPRLPQPHCMLASRVGLVANPVTSRRVLHLENDYSSFVSSADGHFMHRDVG